MSWGVTREERREAIRDVLRLRLQRLCKLPSLAAAPSQLQHSSWWTESAAPPSFTCCNEPALAGAENTEAAHLFQDSSVFHRGTLLSAIQMRKKLFPAYLKSPGAAARTTGADSPLSFVGAIVGGLHVGIGGVMRGLRPPDGGAFAVQRPLDTG